MNKPVTLILTLSQDTAEALGHCLKATAPDMLEAYAREFDLLGDVFLKASISDKTVLQHAVLNHCSYPLTGETEQINDAVKDALDCMSEAMSCWN